MTRLPRVIAASMMCACLAGVAHLAARAEAAQTSQTAGKMTPEEILDYHLKDEKGGSAGAGRAIYEKQCGACHIFGGIGKEVGPDLTTITSRFKKKDILDAILWPSKVISDQYQAEMIQLADGKVITGLLVRESPTAVFIRTGDNPERPVSVLKAQIAERAVSSISLMPEGLLDGLSHTDIANLLAFLMAPPPAK